MSHEIHLSIDLAGQPPSRLEEFSATHGLRFLHILLDEGQHPSQPMLSWRQEGELGEIRDRAARLGEELRAIGMAVLRLKVEVDPAELGGRAAAYFEAHYKVELRPSQRAELRELATELGVHLSRNARCSTAAGELRYLTARHEDQRDARALFDRVERRLRDAGWSLLSVEREAVLVDSNRDLDAGWSP